MITREGVVSKRNLTFILCLEKMLKGIPGTVFFEIFSSCGEEQLPDKWGYNFIGGKLNISPLTHAC
jgi:hypothetical protein